MKRRQFPVYEIFRRYVHHRVCVIGSGPSGFYSTKYLLDDKLKEFNIHVDMVDKLPSPFGLVRYGVAPDHPEVKSVIDQFMDVAKNHRFRYYGNVEVGKDLTIKELKERYSAILFAYGAEGNRNLNIPGEDLDGVYSAREFVNWYNGHPEYSDLGNKINFRKIRNVVIIGQGNVALDCARILAKDKEELAKTDITSSSLERLKENQITHISLVGRRGYGQIACTIKELRELTKLQGVNVVIDPEELEKGKNESTQNEILEKRPLKRLTELLVEITETSKKRKETRDDQGKVEIGFRFLLKPKEIRGKENSISEVVLERCELQGEPHRQSAKSTGEEVILPCDLLLTSIGYKTLPISSDLPFNFHSHTIPHLEGRVKDETKAEVIKGLYVTGWCKRGPTGIIGTNISDAKESVGSIVSDIQSGALQTIDDNKALELHQFLMNCKSSPFHSLLPSSSLILFDYFYLR
jgi:adrenodoxin-NADP+ reductase